MTSSRTSPPSSREKRASDPDPASPSASSSSKPPPPPHRHNTSPTVIVTDSDNVLKNRRSMSTAIPSTVPADRFYGKSSGHNANPGSSRTAYLPPSPLSRVSEDSLPPLELVEEPTDIVMHDDRNPPRYTINDNWPDAFGTMHWDTTPGWGESSSGKGDVNAWGASSATNKVEIDGRNFEEEENWWDAARRAECKRPGPGVLPPLLSELLHNPEHTLYSVSASLPKHSHSNSTSSTSSGSSQSQSTIHHPPSAEEVRKAVPHANAYYCKEHNGWVLLSWCSSTVLPPFARSFNPSSPLPDQARRKRTQSCVGEGEQPFGQANKTHHFHKYERAVDARMLNTPFKRSEWEEEELLKRRRRKMTLHEETMDTSVKVPQVEDEVEGDLLDLYVCCQCSVYCLASQVIPGVIPVKYVEDLTKDKLSHPSLDKTAHASVLSAWETIITILQNRIFKGENRVLPVTGAKFQSKIGWTPVIRQIFEQLGFPLRPLVPSEEQPQTLQPPEIDPSTPAGRRMRGKLLRAWVEVCAYTIIFQKSKSSTSFGNYDAQKLSVTVESAREMYQTGIGAHVNQIPRGLLPDNLLGCTDLNDVWEGLGMTPSSYSHDLVTFAYLAQCRCDPANTPTYFGHLHKLHEVMKTTGVPSSAREEIEMLLLQEKSRGRWSKEDLKRGAAVLGFGLDNALGVDLDDEVDEEFILRAWKDGLKRSWTMEDGNERRMQLYDALKILSELKSSKRLLDAWTHEKGSGMSPDAAYLALQVSKEVEDDMLITVYTFAVQDQPSQIEKMRNALTVIAESRDSQRLRGFLETGVDPGDVVQQVKMDMPRGLNQLGNTCYLNSLLQYFYTIKDLREAVTPLAATDFKTLEEKKLSDDDLKRHRVGGRLVTRREILRSKKFVNQLAELFWNLEYSEIPAVTPTMDLAKLALVTSQDEEEDDQCGTATDASNDTDATLVDDGPLPSRTQERSNSASPVVMSPGSMSDGSSVLGKRTRTDGPMDVDMDSAVDKGKDSYVVVEKPEASSSKGKAGHSGSAEVEMVEDVSKPQPPALPPRKPREVDDSVMMFGRQHDVSECMDNCMFQIETALLDFHEMAGTEDDKTSVVKRLFYGKKRQRLAPLDASEGAVSRYSVHEKEDLFSHLHVNVSEEGYDLYDGLSRYFDDVVEFEGVKRRMEVTLVDLPPLLQIQLQRVQFDRETQQAYKSQAYVKFGETIYLDRFMDTAAPEKKARAKAIQTRLNACRDRIYKLTQGKHAPFAPALGGVADFLEKQDALRLEEVDDDFIAVIKAEKDHVSAVLEQERAEAGKLKEELEAVWKDDVSSPYELTSVFIHRGASPSWGHYFFYSRHLPDKPDSWFKYNDSDVSIVPKEEVLADTTGSTANPYMLVFTRKDSDVVHTVHRFDADQLQDA